MGSGATDQVQEVMRQVSSPRTTGAPPPKPQAHGATA